MTQAKIKTWMLNGLSHPGPPPLEILRVLKHEGICVSCSQGKDPAAAGTPWLRHVAPSGRHPSLTDGRRWDKRSYCQRPHCVLPGPRIPGVTPPPCCAFSKVRGQQGRGHGSTGHMQVLQPSGTGGSMCALGELERGCPVAAGRKWLGRASRCIRNWAIQGNMTCVLLKRGRAVAHTCPGSFQRAPEVGLGST